MALTTDTDPVRFPAIAMGKFVNYFRRFIEPNLGTEGVRMVEGFIEDMSDTLMTATLYGRREAWPDGSYGEYVTAVCTLRELKGMPDPVPQGEIERALKIVRTRIDHLEAIMQGNEDYTARRDQ